MRAPSSAALLQIACRVLLLASCVLAKPKVRSTTAPSESNLEIDSSINGESQGSVSHRKQLEDELDQDDLLDAEKIKNEQLPILPPIILLDFVNGTRNFTDQNDEKSKRTIDHNLGYGFSNNNIFSGKHNFYFPSGKTGTSVSIEESISPFAPKTVTEIIKPITRNSKTETNKNSTSKTQFENLPNPLPLQTNYDSTPFYPPYPVFGQRTKLQKTSPSSELGSHYQSRQPANSFSTSYTTVTPSSATYKKLASMHTSSKPYAYQAISSMYSSSANINGYSRPVTAPILANYVSDVYNSNNQKSSTDLRPSATANPSSANINLSDYPKYTIENGIKYEHKIVWKYPDGKISETPPMSYMSVYSEYPEQQRVNVGIKSNFKPSPEYEPVTSQQYQSTGFTANIYSQKPVQFPREQEEFNQKQPKEHNAFYSTLSMPSPIAGQFENSNSYNLATYQAQFGLKQNGKPKGYSRPVMNNKNKYTSTYNHQQIPKYTVNSPDPEYNYNNHKQTVNLFMPNGQVNKQVLSRYSPEAQQYLTKVFTNGKTEMKNDYSNDGQSAYANTEYSNLLNYNPSISQYIKNPSSILNAQPTFIQAGNSLIPVIILRVDGAPPVQPKVAPNINLQSLLRQYLTQYANSVTKATQNTNYRLGGYTDTGEASSASVNPVEDLKHLTESLVSLRQRGHLDPDFSNSYVNSYQQPLVSQATQSQGIVRQDYSNYYKDYKTIHSGPNYRKPQQKVKSVQIIEDPRYTS